VDSRGRYTAEVPLWTGQARAGSNPKIVALLAETGFLLNKPGETVRHQYPHCWRWQSTRLLFRATSQWFARLGDRGDADQPARKRPWPRSISPSGFRRGARIASRHD